MPEFISFETEHTLFRNGMYPDELGACINKIGRFYPDCTINLDLFSRKGTEVSYNPYRQPGKEDFGLAVFSYARHPKAPITSKS